VIAANRDEFYARPATTPVPLAHGRAVGGRDLAAGGSWLALGKSGLVVGVLNRRSPLPPDPSRLSRGALCVELATLDSVAAAVEELTGRRGSDYNSFNLLVADRAAAVVARNRGSEMQIETLPPGLHVLTNLDVDEPTCPRISRSFTRFAAIGDAYRANLDVAEIVQGLAGLLADHQLPLDDRRPFEQLCIHTPGYGTRSSSLLVLSGAPSEAPRFLHAAGPPCRSAYSRVTLPWDQEHLPCPSAASASPAPELVRQR
jgi:uncharacterized protein with NRDE domain